MRIFHVTVALLAALSASQGQNCDLPSEADVRKVEMDYIRNNLPEGTTDPNVAIINMTFTCLARVAFDKYSYAGVIVYSTVSNKPTVTQQHRFQMQCSHTNMWIGHPSNAIDYIDPPKTFDIEIEYQCKNCEEKLSSTPNYNSTTRCVYCSSNCLSKGGGFCTGKSPSLCCPYFNSDTGDCVDDCTTIHSNFGPNANFQCVCQISCPPGYTKNTTQCSCELTDGCEAAGQPCRNGGNCTSQLSNSPYYSCQCVAGYTGQNCEIQIMDCGPGCMDGQCDIITGCCMNCTDGLILENNCNCVQAPTTQPPTTPTEPTDVCPASCLDCEVDNPTCCSVCPDGFVVASCQCVEAAGPAAASTHVAGIAIGLLLLILLIMSLAALLAYVLYYMWDNKTKMKKGQRMGPFNRSDLQNNPLYIDPEEVET